MNITKLIAAVAAATIALAAPGHAAAITPSAAPTTVPTVQAPPSGRAPAVPSASATPAPPPPRSATVPKAPAVRTSTKTSTRTRAERADHTDENGAAATSSTDAPDATEAPAAAARPVVVTRAARGANAAPKVRVAGAPRAGAASGAAAGETGQQAATDAAGVENDAPKATTEVTAARPDLSPPMRGMRQRMMDDWKAAWQRTKSFASAVIHHPQRYHIGAAIIAGLNIGAAIFVVATTGDFVTAINLVTAAATIAGAGALLHKFVATVDPNAAGKGGGAATHETAAHKAPETPNAGPAPVASTVPVYQVKRVYNFLANKADKADGSLLDASTSGGAVKKATVNQLPGDAKTVAGDLPGAQAYVMQVKGEAFHVVSARVGANRAATTTAFVFGPDGALIASGKTTPESPTTITWDETPTMPEAK